jgi:hypothetical protein
MPMLSASAKASTLAPMKMKSHPYLSRWWVIIAFTRSRVNSRLAFSWPSVVMTKTTFDGRSCSGSREREKPTLSMVLPTASSSAVEPRVT